MLLVGLAFVLFAALLQWTTMSIIGAAALIGVGFIILGFILGDRVR